MDASPYYPPDLPTYGFSFPSFPVPVGFWGRSAIERGWSVLFLGKVCFLMRDLPRPIGFPEVCKAFFVVKVCTLFADLHRFFADLPHFSSDLPRPDILLFPGGQVPDKPSCATIDLPGTWNAGSCPRPSFFSRVVCAKPYSRAVHGPPLHTTIC